MNYLPEEGYKRILVIVLYVILSVAFGFLFFKYLLKILLPFIIAWCVAMVIRPMIEILHKRTRISKKLLSIILVLIILVLIGALLFMIIDRLLYEIRGIVFLLNTNADSWITDILKITNKLLDKIPFLKSYGSEQELLMKISEMSREMLSNLTYKVPEMLKTLITVLPNMLFVSLILIMASYYFCADYNEITTYLIELLPPQKRERVNFIKQKLRIVGIKVIKGYLITIAITFIQLYIGFLIIGTEYAFTIALITALIDILPVIGVGTVLIPWAAFKILSGSYYQGFGLLIIFAVVSVVREIAEPKIIGKSIGLHPLATLFSMYIGLEICGFWGMISFPVLVIVLKTIFSKNEKYV